MKTYSELMGQIKESAKPKRTLIRHRPPELLPAKKDAFMKKVPVIKKIYFSSMIGRKSPITISPTTNVVAQKVQK
jgi:hypothetical protein